MFCHILLPIICSLILSNICNGQLIEDGKFGKKSDKETTDKPPTSQLPAVPLLPSSVCSFLVVNGKQEICPLIEDPLPGLFSWKFGTGENYGWDGGPNEDASGSISENGYMFANMQESISNDNSAFMITKVMPKTEAIGKCLSFQYAIDGIDVDQFHVIMMVNSSLQSCQETTNTINDFLIPKILWSAIDTTFGHWKTKRITYSSHYEHILVFNAIATERIGYYNSYVAIDNLKISNGHCENECLFNKDFCQWTNSKETKLLWRIRNTLRDDINEPSGGDTSLGGIAFIPNERQKRNVGDKARLISKEILHFESLPKCMRFFVFMSGDQFVTLRILKQDDAGRQTEIWSRMSKKEDCCWDPYQVTISDKNSTTNLMVSVEAETIQPGQGEVAIDSITFEDNNCPIVEPTNTDKFRFDCTFETSTCSWEMKEPNVCSKPTTSSMVSRVTGNEDRPKGHSWNPRNKSDSYIMFDFGNYPYEARDSGLLVSPIFTEPNDDYCFSFWYLMYTTVTYPPSSIGSLSLIMVLKEKEVVLWKISNEHTTKWVRGQVPIEATEPYHLMFKATKGCIKCGVIAIDDISFFSHKCNTEPEEAKSSPVDCAFDNDMCGYTYAPSRSANDAHNIKSEWQTNREHSILDGCSDNTFDITPGGFAFVSAVSPQEETPSWLVSPILISSNTKRCFTFYFRTLSLNKDAKLKILSQDPSTYVLTTLWTGIASLDYDETWLFDEVELLENNQKIIFEASNLQHGGWAIDDIKITEERCHDAHLIIYV